MSFFKETKLSNAMGIRVTPVKSSGVVPFEIMGEVTYKIFPEDGTIYYCGGRSFPAKIVEVLCTHIV